MADGAPFLYGARNMASRRLRTTTRSLSISVIDHEPRARTNGQDRSRTASRPCGARPRDHRRRGTVVLLHGLCLEQECGGQIRHRTRRWGARIRIISYATAATAVGYRPDKHTSSASSHDLDRSKERERKGKDFFRTTLPRCPGPPLTSWPPRWAGWSRLPYLGRPTD